MIIKDSVADIASSGEKYLHNNDTIELNFAAIENVQIMKDKKTCIEDIIVEITVLLKAPSRYFEFAMVSWRTPFLQNSEWCSVFSAVFTPVFVLYVVSSAGGGILRYALLRELIGNRMDMLPSVVGATDAVGTAIKIFIDLSRKWNQVTSEIVDKQESGVLAASLYNIGTVLLVVSAAGHSLTARLAMYVIGDFIMGKGKGLLWSISSQVLKDHGKRQIQRYKKEQKSDEGVHLLVNKESWDIDAKISQVQVLFRFGASAIGPIFVTQVLIPNISVSNSYFCLAALISVLCVGIVFLLRRIHKAKKVGNSEVVKKVGNGELVVGWREVVPSWLQFNLFGCCTTATTTEPAVFTKPGYFSDAWIDCGLLNGLTEVVRAGYARVICLRALSMGLTPIELAHALTITGATAVALFWLSDVADRNRRLASFLSFSVLGFGHLGLGLASSASGVFVSAFIFGAGEGFSSGLRDLNKRDYRDKHGPIGDRSREFVAAKLGRSVDDESVEEEAVVVRRQIQGLASPWSDWCDILNSIAVGVIGHYCGMRLASFTYMGVAIFAAYVSAAVIPDSKPPFVFGTSDRPLWTSWGWLSSQQNQHEHRHRQQGVVSYSSLSEPSSQEMVNRNLAT